MSHDIHEESILDGVHRSIAINDDSIIQVVLCTAH